MVSHSMTIHLSIVYNSDNNTFDEGSLKHCFLFSFVSPLRNFAVGLFGVELFIQFLERLEPAIPALTDRLCNQLPWTHPCTQVLVSMTMAEHSTMVYLDVGHRGSICWAMVEHPMMVHFDICH